MCLKLVDRLRATIYPGAIEVCDGKDNNCDGTVDEGFGIGAPCSLPGVCGPGGVECATPNTTQCSSIANASAEICDGLDNDCNGVVDDDFGVGSPCTLPGVCGPGLLQCNGPNSVECSSIVMASPEICDGLDNNCNGVVDEGFSIGAPCTLPGVCGSGVLQCDGANGKQCSSIVNAVTWYQDADGDGYGNTLVSMTGCVPPPGYVAVGGDCDDSKPHCTTNCIDADGDGWCADLDCDDSDPSTHPGAVEICDNRDNDCDGGIDEPFGGTASAYPLRCASADTDGDGLPDTWERFGFGCTDSNCTPQVDLPAMGASPARRDIFLEIDWMEDNGPTFPHTDRFDPEAFLLVQSAFLAAPVTNPDGSTGVSLHVDGGPGSIMNPLTGAPWGTLPSQSTLGQANNVGHALDIDLSKVATYRNYVPNFQLARRGIFHYAIAAHSLETVTCYAPHGVQVRVPYTGIAYMPGDNFIVTPRTGAGGDRTDYATGLAPSSVAVGDFDGDGKPDLAVADNSGVSVLLNMGGGAFGGHVDYAAGAYPVSVAVADFNRDGNPDLAVANAGGNSVSILLGNGDGTFAAHVDYGYGRVLAVGAGDLNGDGWPDLVVVSYLPGTVGVFLNNGDGTFGAKTSYPTGISPQSVAMGDLNGYGGLDLVVADVTAGGVTVLINDGNGRFGAQTTYAASHAVESVAIGDLNGDGKRDLVMTIPPSSVGVLLNLGNGRFGPLVTYESCHTPHSVAVGDFDNNGKPDLAVGCPDSNVLSIMLNDGNGVFNTQTGNYAVGVLPISVAVGDFDGDGKPDAVVVNSDSATATVMLNSFFNGASIWGVYLRGFVPGSGAPVGVVEQAISVMHELGHNLGLSHGGERAHDQAINRKPNYLSIMNYTFAYTGLSIGGSLGHLDYSRFLLPPLDELNLSEANGLAGGSAIAGYGTVQYCPTAYADCVADWSKLPVHSVEIPWYRVNGPIDWNCDGRMEPSVKADINLDGTFGGESNNSGYCHHGLCGFDDWQNLDPASGGWIGALALTQTPAQPVPREASWEELRALSPRPYGVLVLGQGSGARAPGAQAEIQFAVINDGENPDSYTLRATSSRGLTDVTGTARAIFLDPGQVQTFSFPLKIPADTARGLRDEVVLRAESVGNPLLAAADTVTTVVSAYRPVANARWHRRHAAPKHGGSIVLDGRRSISPSGAQLRYTWQTSLQDAPLASTALAEVSVPAGTRHLQLVVNDGVVDSAPTVISLANPCIHGKLVFGPRRFSHGESSHLDEVENLKEGHGGPVCIRFRNGDRGGHRVSAVSSVDTQKRPYVIVSKPAI